MVYELSMEDESILRYIKDNLKIDSALDRQAEDTIFRNSRFYYKLKNGCTSYNIVVETSETTFNVGVLCKNIPLGVAYVTRNNEGGSLVLNSSCSARNVELTKWVKKIYQYTYLLTYLSFIKDSIVVKEYKDCIVKYRQGIRLNRSLEQIVNQIIM